MKKIIHHIFLLLSGVILLTACNDFLDEMPDNRTEIDTPEKITKLLISAYSQNLPILVHEQMSDNVTDRGIAYTWDDENCRDAYLFNHTFSTIDTDSPHDLWEQNYKAVAAANLALESIEKLEAADSSLDLSAQKGEALICRAYAHFTLCNIFCQPYNPQSSTTDLGVPYVTKVETTAENQYERGTVAQVYEKIAADIEEGLPLIDDNLYKQPKYHFTRTATNAFAAQFYLFYGKYQEAVTHATAAIGENPSSIMRDYSSWKGLTGGDEYTSAWVDSKVQANLLLQGIHSMSGRMAYDSRAVHTYELLVETTDSRGPTWGAGSLIFSKYIRFYGSTSGIPSYIFPKQMEYFVFTNEAENIGYAYILNVAYSVEKTLLNRAEAYTLLEQYDKAATDLSYFYVASNARAADVATITGFYETAGSLYKKPMAPRFTVNAGTQENMIHACLHARRILTLHEGTRLLDLKRYGIAYTHVNLNGTDINIEPYDKRLALQIPGLVISAGMQPNPR